MQNKIEGVVIRKNIFDMYHHMYKILVLQNDVFHVSINIKYSLLLRKTRTI